MKKIIIVIALIAVNISWAQGKLIIHRYKSVGDEFIQRVINTHPHVDPKYIWVYAKQTQKLIDNHKAYACAAYKDGNFLAQAVLIPQKKNKHLRQELVGLAEEAIIDENSIHDFTHLLHIEFPNNEGLACCFPKQQLQGFEKLLKMTGYKAKPEISEYNDILKEDYDYDFTDHLWYAHDFETIRKDK